MLGGSPDLGGASVVLYMAVSERQVCTKLIKYSLLIYCFSHIKDELKLQV